MLDRDPRRLAAWAAAALVLRPARRLVSRRARGRARGAAPPPAASIAVRSMRGGGRVVRRRRRARSSAPGVYRLPASARVEDALERAGGPTRGADLSQINRAAKLEDGRQILVAGALDRPRAVAVARRRRALRAAPEAAGQPQHGDARATGHARRRRPGDGAEDPRLPRGARRVRLRRRARPDPGHRREAPRARCASSPRRGSSVAATGGTRAPRSAERRAARSPPAGRAAAAGGAPRSPPAPRPPPAAHALAAARDSTSALGRQARA